MPKELAFATLCLLQERILTIRYKDYVNITQENIEVLNDAIDDIYPNGGPILIYYNITMSFEFSAMRYLSKSNKANAVGVVYESKKSVPVINNMVRIFQGFKASYKMKYFTDEIEAKEWLSKFV